MIHFSKAVFYLWAAGMISVFSLSACQSEQSQEKKPNIIYILADDMGYADLGCYGQQIIKTPNLDQLAAEGMKFTRHYAGSNVFAPSRCVLMTGLSTAHSQVRGNHQGKPFGQTPLAENTTTIATLLKSAGCATALIGKWGLGVESNSGNPLKQGFDYYYGYLCQILAHNHCPEYLMENDEKVYLDNKVIWDDTTSWTKGLGSYPIERKQFSQELFTSKALSFVEENKDKPFFLYMPSIIPHVNGEAPEGKWASDIPSFEPYENEDWIEEDKGYAAMITYLDTDFGKIADKLKSLGIEENTLIIFSSDNGAGAGLSFYDRFKSNTPWRGGKGDFYGGGIRVPMIVKWKGTIKPGSISNHASAFWDVLPTICDVAGIDTPENTDGISFLPELLGEKQEKHESFYFENSGGRRSTKQAVIKDDWKCIIFRTRKTGETSLELYNMQDDPEEQHDVAKQYPEKVKELIHLMNTERTENEIFKL
jgi:arylsulfatase A-like enzyme